MKITLTTVAMLATIGALATPAMAQTTPAQNAADCEVDPLNPACAASDDGSRIVVTGSRIQRQDYNSTTPMVTADEALLDNSSTAAIESNLNRLPQFVPAQTPTAGGDIQPTATNTPGAATVSLRGIGANRNLVLLDGRRSTPSNASGVTDISTIPAAAIERVEVISGGASATYGADAVAGVTNFIPRRTSRASSSTRSSASPRKATVSSTSSRASWAPTSPTAAATSASRCR